MCYQAIKASMNLKPTFKWEIQFKEIIYYRNPATLHSGNGKTDNKKISDSQEFGKENEEWIVKTSENFRGGKLFCLIMSRWGFNITHLLKP